MCVCARACVFVCVCASARARVCACVIVNQVCMRARVPAACSFICAYRAPPPQPPAGNSAGMQLTAEQRSRAEQSLAAALSRKRARGEARTRSTPPTSRRATEMCHGLARLRCMRDVCEMYVRCVQDVCEMYARCIRDVSRHRPAEMYARCMRDVCEMYARCMRDVCEMYARCVRDVSWPRPAEMYARCM